MKNIICLLTLLLVYINVNATDYYFSMMTGVDTNPGTQASPKKSLTAAQALLNTGNKVLFNRGETWVGSLTVQGSGTSGNPIVIGAYGVGANPIITGLSTIASWTNVGGNIWESVMAVSSVPILRTVVIGEELVSMGRFPDPNNTLMSPQSTIHSVPGNGGWLNFEGNGQWYISDNHITGTPNWTGAEIVIKTVNWVIDRGRITSQSGNTINYTPTAQDGGTFSDAYAGMSYFIQDDVRTLTYSNAWYYNPTTKKLRIYSTASPTNLRTATVSTLINGNGKNYISIENINLIGSNGDLISMSGCNYWNFTDCKIEYSGRDGVYSTGSSNCNFLRTTVKDCGNNGIMFRNNCTSNTFLDNIVLNAGVHAGMHDQSQYYSGEGICSIGDNNTFTRNRVEYVGLNGIRFGGSNILVNKNFINQYCYTKSDGGAVYTWGVDGQVTWTNQVIEDNICLNGSMRGSIGTWLENEEIAVKGIYLDATSKNFMIQRNSVANTVGAGIYLNNPLNTTVRYNNIYDARYAGLHLNRYAGNGTMNFKATGNILVAKRLNTFPTGSNQRAFYYKSDANDMAASITTLDSNVYARPLDDFTTTGSQATPTMSQIRSISRVQYNGTFTGPGEYGTQTTYTVEAFRTAFPQYNATRWKAPVVASDTGKMRFEYNWSAVPKNINLGATYVDMFNNSYSSLVLQPYTSITLILTGTVAPTAPTCSAGTTPTSITLPTSSITLTGSGASTSGNTVSYLWTKQTGGAATITSPASATTDVTGLAVGSYTFRLRVTDNTNSLTCTSDKAVIVNPAVVPPTANAGVDQTITLPTNTVTLSGSGTGGSGTITGYSWVRQSGPTTVNIQNATAASTLVTFSAPGVYLFRLTITTSTGATAIDEVQITVVPATNVPPIANAGPDDAITLPATATVSGFGTDTDGSIVAYLWAKLTGPTANIVSPTNSFTLINGLVSGVYTFELRVTDNSGATGRDTMQLTVNPAPAVPPIARAGTDIVITLPTNFTALNGGGSTAGSSAIVSYQWEKLGGSGGTITTPTSASTTITGLSEDTYLYKLTVTDANTLTSTDTIQVVVNAAIQNPTYPTSIIWLQATLYRKSITLNWTASITANTLSFDVEKLQNGTFRVLGNVTPVMEKVNYAWTDYAIVRGNNTYRIRVTDKTGVTYSKAIEKKK